MHTPKPEQKVYRRSSRSLPVEQYFPFFGNGSVEDFAWSQPGRLLLLIGNTKHGPTFMLLRLTCIPVKPIPARETDRVFENVKINFSEPLKYHKGLFHIGPNLTLFNIIKTPRRRKREYLIGLDLYIAK
jgi:hypothetical protein